MTANPSQLHHVSALGMVFFGLSSMLDKQKHDSITVDEIDEHITAGDIIAFLKAKNGGSFAMNYIDTNPAFEAWYVEKLQQYANANGPSEYAIKNRGLCYLVSLTAEIMQQGVGLRLA